MMQTTYPTIIATVTGIISKTKGLKSQTVLAKNSLQALGFDQLDLVNVILALEKKYHITIPDEAPVESVDDLVQLVYARTAA